MAIYQSILSKYLHILRLVQNCISKLIIKSNNIFKEIEKQVKKKLFLILKILILKRELVLATRNKKYWNRIPKEY